MQHQVLFLGSDESIYGSAREIHEAYGVKSTILAAANPMTATRNSEIIEVKLVPGINDDPIFITEITKIGQQFKAAGQATILVGSGDKYAALIAKHKAALSEYFVIPYVDYERMIELNHKETFEPLAAAYGLDMPATQRISAADVDHEVISPWGYPVILKSDNSVEWMDLYFPGHKKIYFINSTEELNEVIKLAYENGYTSTFTMQDMIPGDDSYERNLTAYIDQNHKVRVISMGHALIEDPGPQGRGNHMAIMPDYNEDIYRQYVGFLESLNITGFANFDLKYDQRDHKFKVFEMNVRLGRSNFWASLNGVNWMEYLISDYDGTLGEKPVVFANADQSKWQVWMAISPRLFKKYARNNAATDVALKLLADGKYGYTYKYAADWNYQRFMNYWRANRNFAKYYAKYFKA
ncbi:carboxylate--amine ligase [Periweissella fabaria]|uniref:D-aspartate ligase n=1 Tax=Periweissella fabaria TaxID=546157 RepID=A0ABM8Z7K5_9LACO|nr:carboxylate--amine ligase [Periweissella fabaria]MCM0597924.1 carboxylate--amine ligase [Periweissella fabaria]CAH0417377.1 D-aspartate ligase [Periweissella fabaria]